MDKINKQKGSRVRVDKRAGFFAADVLWVPESTGERAGGRVQIKTD